MQVLLFVFFVRCTFVSDVGGLSAPIFQADIVRLKNSASIPSAKRRCNQMKKNVFLILLFFIVLVGLSVPQAVFAQRRKITVKLASLVPEATDWGKALNKLAKQWADITGGEVELKVYHGGVAGSEGDVLRKLKIDQLQAAVLTSLGMNQIAPQIMALSFPFLIRTEGELDAVLLSMKPYLEEQINKTGYTTLAWSKAGWMRFFARQPVRTPDDMKKQKLSALEEAPPITNAFKAMGYQMIAIPGNEVLVSLNSGRLDAVMQSPVIAGSYQLFPIAKNMSNFNIAPFLGGIVISQTAWRRIPEKYHEDLLAVCRATERENDSIIQKLEADAVTTMRRYGLQTIELSESDKQKWYADVDRARPQIVGSTFDAATLGRIEAILKEYRAK
jgi:TRAP-type C4-dicarboxylate transport system substrate-binding protein